MEFVDRFQALVRNVSVVFEKPKQERSKCPRCKGSGLLLAQGIFPWDRHPPSNQPCWFCEGIGVMPVAGLSGFMLGRASAMFQTRDLYLHNRLPVQAQLYLGKYPGTRPKVGTYKPCEDPESMLHDFSQPPQWLSGENLPSSDKVEEAEKGGGEKQQPMFTRKESLFKSPKTARSSRGGGSSGSGGKSGQRIRVAPRLSRAQASPRSVSSSAKEKERLLTEAPSFSRKSPKAATPAALLEQQHSQNDDPQQAGGGPEFVRLKAPLLKSPKAVRTPRRGRNRVREEAEKTAAERARRIQSSICDAHTDASSAFVPENILLVPAEDGAWEAREASNSQPRFLPWIESSRRSDYSWVNQMVYGSIKERSQTPLSAKLLT